MTRTPPQPFGTPATRLHGGRLVLALAVLVVLGMSAWIWLTRHDSASKPANVETASQPGWTASQMHYDKPEPPKEVQAPKPVDMTAAELARMRAMLAQMQSEIEALKNRKGGGTTIVQPPQPKPQPPAKAPGALLYVSHEIREGPPMPKANEYVLAPSTVLPCIVETVINSDVPGYFVCKVSTNVYDTATGRHLLVAQGSSVLGHDQSDQLIYGSERMNTISLTLTLPDGRSVDLGKAPVTDGEGVAGLTGDIDRHFFRLLGAVFIGGALRGGMTALQVAATSAAGAGQVATGITSLGNQATTNLVQPYINIRPTIRVFAGQIGNILLIKPLSLAAMWE